MLKRICLTSLFVFSVLFSRSQELNCTVQINSQNVTTVDKKVFETLQTAIFEFMNNTRWSNDIYKTDERIDCSLFITINQALSSDEFSARITVQSRRPVYKTSYFTPVITFEDNDFTFKYVELQQLEFSENTFSSNLTSSLAFYAYIFLGLDYDTFAPEGGTGFYQRAQNIVNNASNSNFKGWKAYEGSKNRYWLAENLMNANFRPLRQSLYSYHRKGLDIMNTDLEAGRAEIYTSIEQLQKVWNLAPGSFLLQLFFDAKNAEIVNIFSQAFPETKNKVVTLLNQMDPAHTTQYQKILAQ